MSKHKHQEPKLLSRVQMENLATPRLLAYKNRLLGVPEGPDYDVLWEDAKDCRVHKKNPLWQECYEACREILSGRENVK